jgi:hypothetical protein
VITKKYSGFIGGFENAKLLPKTAKMVKREKRAKAKKKKTKEPNRNKKRILTKGMQSGVEVVKTEGKTSEELAAEVKAKKQKYELAISAGVNAWEAFKRANRDSGL